jgi:pyridinium-3,5-biscarboxylic acid mononucleotide sulfurtransferase
VDLQIKEAALRSNLKALGRLIVAYSGGVDSAYLAFAAHRVLGADMLAVIADSPSLPRTALQEAIAFAEGHAIALQVVATAEMDRAEYVRNDAARCFHCKDELFDLLEKIRDRNGYHAIAYGVNLDDQSDFRPGQQAARQHGVVAPLLEAELNKAEIRELARQSGLGVWNKPAAACLSSRIEYGRAVTTEALTAVEQGEEALRALGFRQLRVRHHGEIVRVEIDRSELARALDPKMAAAFTKIFKALGFKFVTLDLEGFRSGSMNSLLPVADLHQRK